MGLVLLLLPAVLYPLAAAALVLAGGRLFWRGPGAGALALVAGYVAGHVAILTWPPWPPVEAVHRLFYLVGAAGVLGLVQGSLQRAWLRGALFALVALGGSAFLLLTSIRTTWTWDESMAWVAGLGLAVLTFRASLEGLAWSRPEALFLLLPAILAASALVAFAAGDALLSQLTLALLAALVPVLAWSWRQPAWAGRGARAVGTVVLGGLWIIGGVYGNMPATSLVLLAAVLPSAWLVWQRAGRLAGAGSLAAVRVALPLALVALAVVLAVPSDQERYEAADVEVWPTVRPAGSGSMETPPPATSEPEDNPFEQWTHSAPAEK